MKDLILIALGLVIVVTGVWFLWPDSTSPELPTFDVEDVIVFTCGTWARTELCLINTDGSGFVQLTNLDEQNRNISGIPINANLAPAFNNNGQIAWHCNRDGTLDVDGRAIRVPGGFNYICIMNLDGSEYQLFEDRNLLPNVLINDQGQIFYGCDYEVICRMNFDGSDKREFEIGFFLSNFMLPAFMTENSLMLSCPEYGGTDSRELISINICALDQSTGTLNAITDNSMHEFYFASSDNGNLIFTCTTQSLFDPFNLCRWENGGRKIVVDPAEDVSFATLTINNAGQAAVTCGIDNTYNLCLVQEDDYNRLEYRMDYDSPLAINSNGTIAFFCKGEPGGLCTVNHNGTGFTRLLEESKIEVSTLRGGLAIQ